MTRTITTLEELEALPGGAAVLNIGAHGHAIFQRSVHTGDWYLPAVAWPAVPLLPTTVLYDPSAPPVPAPDLGETSDGHHTFNELYEYRMLYNAHAAQHWLAAGYPVVKSWHHSDGEPCFGGGWFIVVATLPTGQVSNHYSAEHWKLFEVPQSDLPPEYDGHSPSEAATRLRTALGGAK